MTTVRIHRTLLISAVATISIHCHAASSPWGGEPKEIFGIAIGGPTSSLTLPDCYITLAGKILLGATCVVREGSGKTLMVGNLPDVVPEMGTVGTMDVVDGRVASFRFRLQKSGYRAFKAVMVERYGVPSREVTSDYQNGFGATFRYETVDWIGSQVSIRLAEHDDEQYSSVVFFSVPLLAQQADLESQRVKDAAKKLQ